MLRSVLLSYILTSSGGLFTVTTLCGNTSVGSADGSCSSATFAKPSGICAGPNSAYALVADYDGSRIRYINLTTRTVTALAGSGASGYADGHGTVAAFATPNSISIDAAGTFAVITDTAAYTVRRLDLRSGVVTTIAGTGGRFGFQDGPGTLATFVGPKGIALDAVGVVAIVADYTTHTLRRLNVTSTYVTTIAGLRFTAGYMDGVVSLALFNSPAGVVVDSRGAYTIVVSDPEQQRAACVARCTAGITSQSDHKNHVIRRLNISTGLVTTLAGNYSSTQLSVDGPLMAATFSLPSDVALDSTGLAVLVVDHASARIRRVNLTSGLVETIVGQTVGYADGADSAALFNAPTGCALDLTGTLLVTDTGNNVVRAVSYTTPLPSPSPSPSQSVSPYPFALALQPLSSSTYAPATVSDSLTPINLHLWLSRCPSLSDAALFAASSVLCAGESIFAALSSTTAMDDAAATVAANLASPCAAGDTAVRLSAIAWAGVPFRSIATRSSLVCRITSATNQTLAAASIPLVIRLTLWPLWDDAIVVSANGVMRSTRLGISINATSELSRAGACIEDITYLCGMGLPMRVLSAGQALWGNTSISEIGSSAPGSRPFSLTVSGSSRIMLRARWPAFSRNASSNASLGGVACNVSALSDDGAWVLIDTPSSTVLCGSATRDCGYVSLSLSNAPTSAALGATLSCPPFCAGALDHGAVPLATGSGTFSLGSSPRTAVGSLPTYVAPLTTFSSMGIYYSASCSQTGLWPDTTSSVCQNASDPASAACPFGGGDGCTLCPSNAVCPGGYRELRCRVVGPIRLVSCSCCFPRRCHCPCSPLSCSGAWPRPNAWTASEFQDPPVIYTCPRPLGRCLGWNVTLGSSQCGVPYLQGSFLCSACSPGYFLDATGTCNACPILESAWQRYSGLLYICVAIAVIILVLYAFLAALVLLVGGTITGGFTRMSKLAFWALMCAQVVSDAAVAASPSLIPLIAKLYAALLVLQFQGILLSPGCIGAPPFVSETSTLAIALGLWALSIAFYYVTTKPATRLVGQYVLMAALVMYPSAIVTSLNLLNCNAVTLPVSGAVNLDGGPSITESDLIRGSLVTLSVSVYDPYFVCWQGSHAVPGVLAAIALPCFVVGLPLLTFIWLWRDPWVRAEACKARGTPNTSEVKPSTRPSTASGVFSGANPLTRVHNAAAAPSPASSKQTRSPIAASLPFASPDNLLGVFFYDYKPSAWYTKHLDMAVLLVLSIFRALLPRPTDVAGIAGKTAAICTALAVSCVHVLWVRPYLEADAWMGWVRALMLLDSFGITLLNASALALDAGLGDPSSLYASVVVGSILVFVLCVITLAVLLVGFGRFAFKAAEAEEANIVATRSATAAAVVMSSGRVAGALGRPSSIGAVRKSSAAAFAPEAGAVEFTALLPSSLTSAADAPSGVASASRHAAVRRHPTSVVVDEDLPSTTWAPELAIVASQSRPSLVGGAGMLQGKITVRRPHDRPISRKA